MVGPLADVLAEGMKQGEFRKLDPSGTARVLFLCGHALFRQGSDAYPELLAIFSEITEPGLGRPVQVKESASVSAMDTRRRKLRLSPAQGHMLFEMEEAGSETLVCLLNTVDGYLSRYVPESVHGEPAERNWRYVDDLLFLRRIGLIEIRRSMYIRGGLRTESTLRDGAEFDRALQKMRSLTWDSSVSRWTSGPGTDDLEIVLTDEGELALRT